VLVVMPEQWPRALLRSALRETGYDAVGTRNLSSALRIPVTMRERAPVRLIVVDQAALDGDTGDRLERLVASHGHPPTMLIARSTSAIPAGSWDRVLRRPLSVADIVRAVQTRLPLPPAQRSALD
jgi:AmiR/NasT family two-component response regulator